MATYPHTYPWDIKDGNGEKKNLNFKNKKTMGNKIFRDLSWNYYAIYLKGYVTLFLTIIENYR